MKSDHNYTLELSEEAYKDLVDIQTYTYSQFGHKQWKTYSSFLDHAFQFLLKNPLAGHHRDDIPEKYQAWTVKEHIIIYRIEANDNLYRACTSWADEFYIFVLKKTRLVGLWLRI